MLLIDGVDGMPVDGNDDIDLQQQMQDNIHNFAIQLMLQRRTMQSRTSGDVLKRQESFNTEMGMAFSASNDIDDY